MLLLLNLLSLKIPQGLQIPMTEQLERYCCGTQGLGRSLQPDMENWYHTGVVRLVKTEWQAVLCCCGGCNRWLSSANFRKGRDRSYRYGSNKTRLGRNEDRTSRTNCPYYGAAPTLSPRRFGLLMSSSFRHPKLHVSPSTMKPGPGI